MRTLLITAITSLAFIGTAIAGPIHDAAQAGYTAEVRRLVDSGADINARNEYGLTPLYLAVLKGHADTIAGRWCMEANERKSPLPS